MTGSLTRFPSRTLNKTKSRAGCNRVRRVHSIVCADDWECAPVLSNSEAGRPHEGYYKTGSYFSQKVAASLDQRRFDPVSVRLRVYILYVARALPKLYHSQILLDVHTSRI